MEKNLSGKLLCLPHQMLDREGEDTNTAQEDLL